MSQLDETFSGTKPVADALKFDQSALERWMAEQFAYLIDSLKATPNPEGDGTLLDNMAVLATSGISLGRTHSLDEFPLLTAGSCCGALKTNVHYRASSPENASKVILTMMRAMGMLVNSFGEGDAETTDTLSAIET